MGRKKTPKKEDERLISTSSSEKNGAVQVGDISQVSGEVNIAGRDIVKNIQTIYERALTPGESIEKDLEIETKELAQGIRDYLDGLKQQVTSAGTSTPYKGLESYMLSDATVFFGRDQAIRDLREAMKRGRLTVLQAESGAGKTSLLQAGIIPRLMSEGHLAVLVRPQFDNPSYMLKKAFIGNLELTPKLAGTPLVDFLRRVKRIIGDQTALYLILDQFEEFFSKQTLDQDRQDFIQDLAGCLNDATLNVRWIISITSDVFGQMGKFEPYIRNPFSNVQSLYFFNRQEAMEVIAKPAKNHGFSFQEGLLKRLLNDLSQGEDAPIAPTQIQLVCAALYEDIGDRNTIFNVEQYEQKGGAQGILHDYIGDVLRHHLPQEERAAAYKIFEELVTSEKKRVMRGKSDLETALENKGVSRELTESTLNHLVNRRLLRQLGERGEHLQYEIVHDYLLNEIEISENVQKTKEAEELLEQGISYWKRRGEIWFTTSAIKIIEEQIENLFLDLERKELLLIGSIEHRYHPEKLLRNLSLQERKKLVANWLPKLEEKQDKPEVTYNLLWSLRADLPRNSKSRILAWKVKSLIPQATIILVSIIIIIFAAAQLPDKLAEWTYIRIDWEPIENFTTECKGGTISPSTLIEIDPADTSRVVVADQGMQNLCISENSAASWDSSTLLPVNDISSLSINGGRIYVSSQSEAYFKSKDEEKWQQVILPREYENEDILSITANISNPLEVYLAIKPLHLLVSLDGGQTWDSVDLGTIQGVVTAVAGNKNYLIVTTDQGYWFKKAGSNDWIEYKNSLMQTLPIAHAISIFNPEEPYFFLATEDGNVWSVFLNEDNGLYTEDTWPGKTYHMSTLRTSWYANTSQGLLCDESWDIRNIEWWRWKLNILKPCD